MANTVPLADEPPTDAAPYKTPPDKIKREVGEAPSKLVLTVEFVGYVPVKEYKV
jgi:hypothetical protein